MSKPRLDDYFYNVGKSDNELFTEFICFVVLYGEKNDILEVRLGRNYACPKLSG